MFNLPVKYQIRTGLAPGPAVYDSASLPFDMGKGFTVFILASLSGLGLKDIRIEQERVDGERKPLETGGPSFVRRGLHIFKIRPGDLDLKEGYRFVSLRVTSDTPGIITVDYLIEPRYSDSVGVGILPDTGTPVAVADEVDAISGTPVMINVTNNDHMVNGATLTSVDNGEHGTTEIIEGCVVYTPDTGFIGMDSFNYTITGADGETSQARVTVNVISLPSSVAAVADEISTPEDIPVTIDVTANDNMSGNAVLTSVDNGAHGTTEIVEGKVIYTPETGFSGIDTFTYTITDDDGETSQAWVTVTVNRAPLDFPGAYKVKTGMTASKMSGSRKSWPFILDSNTNALYVVVFVDQISNADGPTIQLKQQFDIQGNGLKNITANVPLYVSENIRATGGTLMEYKGECNSYTFENKIQNQAEKKKAIFKVSPDVMDNGYPQLVVGLTGDSDSGSTFAAVDYFIKPKGKSDFDLSAFDITAGDGPLDGYMYREEVPVDMTTVNAAYVVCLFNQTYGGPPTIQLCRSKILDKNTRTPITTSVPIYAVAGQRADGAFDALEQKPNATSYTLGASVGFKRVVFKVNPDDIDVDSGYKYLWAKVSCDGKNTTKFVYFITEKKISA